MNVPEFVALVAEMRTTQKAWFSGDRSSATLHRSKDLERQVDRACREMKGGQLGLFGTEEAHP